jgi:hypothetical protein
MQYASQTDTDYMANQTAQNFISMDIFLRSSFFPCKRPMADTTKLESCDNNSDFENARI